jgi:hypothetical protein
LLFNIEERKAIASRLLDKGIVEKMFEGVRSHIIELQGQAKYAEAQVKGNPLLEGLVKDKNNYLVEYNFLIDIIEANALNNIKDHEFLLKLADAFLKTDSQTNTELQNLRDQVIRQENETKEFAEHKDVLKWVNEYLKRSSQTTTE